MRLLFEIFSMNATCRIAQKSKTEFRLKFFISFSIFHIKFCSEKYFINNDNKSTLNVDASFCHEFVFGEIVKTSLKKNSFKIFVIIEQLL